VILFLDIDGVLNSQRYLRAMGSSWDNDSLPESQIDPAAVELLDQVLARTSARIVVSSTWRLSHTPHALDAMLVKRGLRAGHVIDRTADLHGRPRGDEIKLWLDTHECGRFVILDDDSDMGPLLHRLVQTDGAIGLQPEHVERVVALLEAP